MTNATNAVNAVNATTERVELPVLRCATAGSVDDGKSTLIGRLLLDADALFTDQLSHVEDVSRRRGNAAPDLSLVTDGLRAEREQGITIDAAWRYVKTAKRRFILADAPGHVQYTRNTLTAASTADVAIILVDSPRFAAAKALLPQTKRHLAVVRFLGVPHVAIAVNKMDEVGFSPEAFAAVRDAVHSYVAGLGVASQRAPSLFSFFPVSALAGDNVVKASARTPWYDGPTLLAHLEQLPARAQNEEAPARFFVQWVRRGERGERRGYAGRVAAGVLRRGDRVRVLPSGQESVVASIVTLNGAAEEARAGASATLELADELDVTRGDLLVRGNEATPEPLSEVTLDVAWVSHEPLQVGAAYLLKHGARKVRALVSEIEAVYDLENGGEKSGDRLSLNEIGRVSVRTSEPLVWDAYDQSRATARGILIAPGTAETVAAAIRH